MEDKYMVAQGFWATKPKVCNQLVLWLHKNNINSHSTIRNGQDSEYCGLGY